MPADSLRPDIKALIEEYLPAEIPPQYLDSFLAVRITDLDGTVTKEKIIEFCKTQSSMFLGGEEYANTHHFHLVIPYDKIPNTSDFTKLVYDYFEVQKVPTKKGDKFPGNSSHSSKKVKNLPEALVYVLKDGDYFSSGFSDDFVKFLYSHSFKKQSMTTTFEEICQDFQDDKITILQLSESLIKLRATFNCLNFSRIQEIVYSQQVIRKPELAQELAETKIKYL